MSLLWQERPHGVQLLQEKRETTDARTQHPLLCKTTETDGHVLIIGEQAKIALAASHSRTWIVDSGAMSHMTPQRDWFEDFSEQIGSVTLGDSSRV